LLQRAEREFERGQYRSALRYCDEALRLDPNHTEAQALRKKITDTMRILGIE
jgi:Tfp pilus assembly protein PilF